MSALGAAHAPAVVDGTIPPIHPNLEVSTMYARVADWDTEAARVADYIGSEFFHAHRGATGWRQPGVVVAFGNDGYADDPLAREAVAMLRAELERRGWPVLGFGTDSDGGYTWAMLIRASDVAEMFVMVWEAWSQSQGADRDRDGDGYGYAAVQTEIALPAMFAIAPDGSEN